MCRAKGNFILLAFVCLLSNLEIVRHALLLGVTIELMIFFDEYSIQDVFKFSILVMGYTMSIIGAFCVETLLKSGDYLFDNH